MLLTVGFESLKPLLLFMFEDVNYQLPVSTAILAVTDSGPSEQ